MKKFNKKLISVLITAICISGLCMQPQPAYAIKKNKETTQQDVTYSNERHSIFSISDCIAIAIRYNPAIRSSFYNEEIYKSQIGRAWANYFPSLSAGLDLSRSGSKYSKEIYYGMGRSTYNTLGYVPKVSADMLLFDFGKTKAIADMAKRQYEGAKEDTKESINNIIYMIKTTYYNILFADAQVKVYEDTVKDYELQLSQAEGFYKLGKKAKIDVVTAEYNLGKAQLNLVQARNILEIAKVQLSKIMGIPEYTNYELSDKLPIGKYSITQDEALNTALNVRPELISAQKNVEAAKMNLRALRREYAPDLGAYAGYSYGIGNKYNLTSTQIGVGLSYNGLNILKVKKSIDGGSAEYKKAQADYEDIKHNVYLKVKESYIDLQTAKEEIVIAKLALDQAQEQYRQVTGRYKAGVGDAIELKDGENTYLNARLDFYNAILNYNTAAASLEKEIGMPIEISKDTIIKLNPEQL